MTRLFLRFYLGVVGILIIAWLTQSWLTGERFAAQNAQVVRDALFGGVRNARDKYRFGLARGLEERLLANIQEQFDYPVGLHHFDPEWEFDLLLTDGEEISKGDGTFIMARVTPGKSDVLLFGPLPQLAEPSKLEVTTGVGGVFLLAAFAIALLLRPVAKQFQQVEETAASIADGDLSARIEEGEGVQSSNLVLAFNNMADRTETMVKSQRELLQAVSHELRTPLSRIHFAIDLIQSGDEATRSQRLDSLTTAADDLDQLVGELISYVRLESTTNQPLPNVELGSIVTAVIAKCSLLSRDVVFEVGERLTAGEVRGNVEPAGFDRAISNLITNAVRHCRHRVNVSADFVGDRVVINVDDDGPGIPENERSRALEPFVRLAESGKGVGLGLSIVRRIVEQHEGEVRILDSPQKGCRVQTDWPASRLM